MEEFENYYKILEQKLEQKDYTPEAEVEEKKERKIPKLSQRQIFYPTKKTKKNTK
jgi:hypothetical protein